MSDDGTTLVLTNRSGTHDILVNSATKYSETGDPNPVTTASPGQYVAVKVVDFIAPPDTTTTTSSTTSTTSSDSTSSTNTTAAPATEPVAGRVTILLQSISGVVTSINGSSVTLTRDEDRAKTLNVSSADIYQRTRAADGTWTTSPATLAVNDLVTAFGEKDGTTPTTFDAQFVKVRGVAKADDDRDNDEATTTTSSTTSTTSTTADSESSNVAKPAALTSHDDSTTTTAEDRDANAPATYWVTGTVASASNGTIVINKKDGSQVTVTTTESTQYRSNNCDGDRESGSTTSTTTPGFSGIAPNDHIAAKVTPSNGALDALVVEYSAPGTSDPSGSWSGDHSSPSGSAQPSGDQNNQQYPSGGSDGDRQGSDGGYSGSYGGGGSFGGGQSGRH